MSQIIPYLNFNGNCREVMNFYNDCLGGELFLQTISEGPMAGQCPEAMHGQVMHSTITRNGQIVLMASDMIGPDGYIPGNNIGLSLNCSSEPEIDSIFAQLSAGGRVLEPVRLQFWGAQFGTLTDRYGIQWMLNFDPNVTNPQKQTLRQEVWIDAPKDRIWDVLLDDVTYRQWTAVFDPGSYAEGDWQEGSRICFKNAAGSGLISRVVVHEPAAFISVRHEGMLVDGKEVDDDPQASGWKGFYETYRVFDEAGGTRLVITQDMTPQHMESFTFMWKQALEKVKELAEKAPVPA